LRSSVADFVQEQSWNVDVEALGLQLGDKATASSTDSSSLVFIHLMRTEVSTTIFPAIAGVSVVSNDVGRIPLANPLLFELSQWSKGIFPRSSLCGLICQVRAQGFTNDLTPRERRCFLATRSSFFSNASGMEIITLAKVRLET
jgi:hypothetical protein